MTGWPLIIALLASVILTIVFAAGVGVPRRRPAGIRGAIMRWGHAVTWVFVCATLAAAAVGDPAEQLVAPLALAALVAYLTFLGTLLGSRPAPLDRQ